jgi:gas vesicle protein
MSHERSRSHGDDDIATFLIGLSIGLVGGLLSALLMTPKPGAEIRDGVSKAFRELPDRVNDELASSSVKTKELLDKTRQNIEDQIDRSRRDRTADRMAKAKQAEEMATGYDFN